MNKKLQFLIYGTPQLNQKITVVVKVDAIWPTQKAMADLFDVQVPAISKHLKNLVKEGELTEATTVTKMEKIGNLGYRGEVITKAEREYEQYNKTQKNSFIFRQGYSATKQ